MHLKYLIRRRHYENTICGQSQRPTEVFRRIGEGMANMIDKEKYALVYKHRDIGIYALKVANPKTDEMGYVVDNDHLPGVYNTVQEAIDEIDRLS